MWAKQDKKHSLLERLLLNKRAFLYHGMKGNYIPERDLEDWDFLLSI